ncbi:unnamed protein product [Cylindrotheca closterium]|uniref:Uncharacterized protein n=1 Tax=Cylindrotheca closterium TaxID=2856 RepID=A0AAD2PV92_9STRA|nr:unnamed protein product [Cylindrotheca closterium]
MNPNDRNRRPPGSKKGVPAIPKRNMDDDEEEVTRRIGGVRPNFSPNLSNTQFASPMLPSPMMQTAPSKLQASVPNKSRQVYNWALHTVPTLPEFYPLERTAVFIAGTSCETIASRIAKVLRERSIEASYDDAKAKVRCMSTEGVDFRVRLYRGRDQFSDGIIVEVQRRFGSGLAFYNETKAILNAAEGKPPAPTPMTLSSRNLPEVSDDEDDSYVPPPSGASSLLVVSKMLRIPGFDGQYLGLSTLATLVDPEKMSPQTSRKVSAELLKPDSESDVGPQVFSYIISRKEDEDYAQLRILALQVLAHAIKATGIIPAFLRGDLRAVLLEDVKAAEKHPRAACAALGSMEFFIHGDEDTMELNEAFESAFAAGEARHNMLMQQAQRCIATIR